MDIQILAKKFYDYSLYFKGYSKDTIKRYKYSITSYCKFANVSTIDQVTEDNVRALFYYGRTERNWNPNTFTVIYKSLRVFFRWCQSQGMLEKNPTDDIEVPKLEKRIPSNLTKQDALRLLEIVYNYPYEYPFVRYRNHAMFMTFIFAGLRKNELLRLSYADVDLENLTIFVRRGKGAKDRIVPISYALAHSLKRYLEERKRLKKTCPEFFASSHRNCGFTENGMEHLVKLIRRSSGIKFTIHKLRHTFATLMWDNGCDIYALSQLLGHSSIETTKIYVHTSVHSLRSQMTKHPLNDLVN